MNFILQNTAKYVTFQRKKSLKITFCSSCVFLYMMSIAVCRAVRMKKSHRKGGLSAGLYAVCAF